MKKKLLLSLGITLLSINSFSKMTITSYNNGSSVSNGSITESGHNFSGIVQFLGNQGGTYVVKLDNGTKIETGTRFDLDPDTTITIEGANGTIGTIVNGSSAYPVGAPVSTKHYYFWQDLDENSTTLPESGILNGNLFTPSVISRSNNASTAITHVTTSVLPPSTASTTTPGTSTPTPSTPLTGTTPTTGSTTSPTERKKVLVIPRSRVDLDLAENAKMTMIKNVEKKIEKGDWDLNIDYVGGVGTKYTDKTHNILQYNGKSNGVILSLNKNYDKLTLGGLFGYQNSKVKYKDFYDGIKEKIDSYQFLLNAKYDFNEKVDLIGTLVYSTNKHKFDGSNIISYNWIDDAEYTSNIFDFETRLGYKYLFTNGYIKPYLGIGVLNLKEGAIDKIGAKKASETALNSVLGIYGVAELNKIDLYGNVEYRQKYGKNSYHNKRDVDLTTKIDALNYKKTTVNANIGLRYKITDMFDINTSYGLNNLKNNIIKIGIGIQY